MKNILPTIIISFLVTIVSVQQDEKAKLIIDKVVEETQSKLTIEAEFTYSMQSNYVSDINKSYYGILKVKGKMYAIELKDNDNKDFCVKIYSNGITLWNYMCQGNQVTVSNTGGTENETINPFSIFSEKNNKYKFKYMIRS